jgi:hypothetical protein
VERVVVVIGLAVGLTACTGDGKGEETCGARDGEWEAVLTLQAGSDALCPEVPPDTFTTSDDTSSDDCDPGCTCAIAEDEATCSATYSESCADAESETDLACDMTIEDDTRMTGSCSITVHVLDPDLTFDCGYDIEASWQGR